MTPPKNAAAGRRAKTAGDASEAKREQLAAYTLAPAPQLTTNQGVPVPDNHHSLKAGPRGPTLQEDFILREKLMHFGRERTVERVAFARGSGAHGYFQLEQSMSQFTCAGFLQDPAQRTPVFVRFSNLSGERGAADTVRDVRGFAVKFYTPEGNYDLVGSNVPVFYIQDAMKFPDLMHALRPEPHHGMPQASTAHDSFWDFVSLMPETTHMLMWAMSDRTLPRSLRMMEGFGVHSFRFLNSRGDSHFVKFHWKPRLGVHALLWDEAQKIAGQDPDFLRRDLWEAIERGDFPEWELGVQMVPEARAQSLGFDLLDATKLIPETLVPVQRIGRLVLDRNPDNFFAETEQVAFNPGHLVPGIDFSNDPLLQGRLMSYSDSQFARLGGPNFHELPINRPLCPVHNLQRDGLHRSTLHRGRAAYEPNTLGDGSECRIDGASGGFQGFAEPLDGRKGRAGAPAFDEHFSQARLFFDSQGALEKEHLIAAFRHELARVESTAIRQRVVDNLAHVDPKLARRVAEPLGLDAPDAKAAAGRAGFRGGAAVAPAFEAPPQPKAGPVAEPSVRSRRVAILVADGVDSATLKPIQQALEQAGALCSVLGPQRGSVTSATRRRVSVGGRLEAWSSVLFDAVLLPAGAEAAAALGRRASALEFVREAYRHGKAICAVGEGVQLLRAAASLAAGAAPPPGVIVAATPVLSLGDSTAATEVARQFMAEMARHRHGARGAAPDAPG